MTIDLFDLLFPAYVYFAGMAHGIICAEEDSGDPFPWWVVLLVVLFWPIAMAIGAYLERRPR